MSDAEDSGIAAVRSVMDNAREIMPPAPEDPPPAEPEGPNQPVNPRRKGRLPDDCPVKPLGINGGYYYYLDASRQLRELKAREHGRLDIQGLFGMEIDELYTHWPRHDRSGAVTGWRPEQAAEALMEAAAKRGVWNVMGRTRGPGAWLSETGELVFHVGDGLIRSRPPGEVIATHTRPEIEAPGPDGKYVYPAAAAQPRPCDQAVAAGDAGPGPELLALLSTWNWKRGDTDAQLLLGWVAAAIVGGALDWRPLAWVTGDAASGKSTLHKLIGWVLGEGLVSVADATPAGIWQKLGHASLPVAFDELEAEEDNRRVNKVVELARLAASGSLMLRGGADHVGSEFVARSCFLFSSILIPPLQSQDRSRMAIMDLQRLDATDPPKMDAKSMGALGARLRRRMLDQWPRFAETLDAYRQELAVNAGHGGRGADVFGTLLACADLVLDDHPPDSEVLKGWADKLKAAALAETRDAVSNHDYLIDHLRTSVLDAYRDGTKTTVGAFILEASGRGSEQIGLGGASKAQEVLGTYGMRYVLNPAGGRAKPEGEWVAFANSHNGLAGLLRDTIWSKRAGTTGVWVQALERVQGAQRGNLRFAGVASRCVLVPYDQVIPPAQSDEGGDGF